ncbi:MAG: hypothetical protein WCF12_15215 [Propionicimonas sp.]
MLGGFDAFVGEPLELAEVACGDGSGGELIAGEFAAFIEEFVELVYVVAGVRQVGKPVERLLIARVSERAQRIVVRLTYPWRGGVVRHILSVQPSSNWKVKQKATMLRLTRLETPRPLPPKQPREPNPPAPQANLTSAAEEGVFGRAAFSVGRHDQRWLSIR